MPLTADEQKKEMKLRSRLIREDVSDIGNIPPIKKPKRRESTRYDLEKFLLTYFKESCDLKFSESHIQLIRDTERVLLQGGNVIAAFPRGSGKTTIFQRAELWATLHGHRQFPMLLCADDKKFKQLLRGIKTICETNQLLSEDFPEVIYPIQKLERVANRAGYQTCRGEPTHIKWGIEQIVFPTVKESKKHGNAGAVIAGGGLTGAAVRGGVVTRPDGKQVRPDAFLIDDPQTRKSAKSQSQCQEREDTINGDILGMAGPGKRTAACCACTVIYREDTADRLLDRIRSPHWKAHKVSMIETWPTNMKLWEEFDTIRRQELLGEMDPGRTQEFYVKNREAMDAGAVVYWDERKLPEEVSALQHAMTLYYRNPRTFMAEFQNCPEETSGEDLTELNALELVRRSTTYERGTVPAQCTHLTAQIDVQATCVYWMICAWSQEFGGHIVDYGTYPDQKRPYFRLTEVKKTFQKASPGNDESGALREGLIKTIQTIQGRTFIRTDGAEMKVERGGVDARWLPDEVERAIIESGCSNNWFPYYGVGIGAKNKPLSQWTKKRGVQFGKNWLIQKPDRKLLRSIFSDVNYWKSQMHQGLSVPQTHTQAVVFFAGATSQHQLLADHLSSERAARVKSKERIVDEWELPSNRPDNHWWDTLIGCAVLASICGIRKGENATQAKPKPRPANRVRQLRI